ncbi:MAG TPA: LLM class F420-dependent oxidoreductase [Candidatus Limnocylindrales bacterium]|nr:LLM class F420-dependent oxidoreductase [Candidatus Limnocylindrales bacterium]
MKVGLQINRFDWPGGAAAIGPTLGRVAATADDVGFDSIWVMDHFFQIRGLGATTDPMLDGQTTLGFLAARTTRARLGLLVGGIHYRHPGLWIKAATTLDVLSGGRAWLGLGAGWNQEESDGLGFPFPAMGERFERLEDTLRLADAMFDGERGTEAPVDGRHLHARRALNVPQSISRPRVPIMVGGGGERRTLRLVARYADACNVFGGPERIAHKYAVLRRHCEEIGRPFEAIERTVLTDVAVATVATPAGGRVQTADQIVDRLAELSDAGAQHVIVAVRDVHDHRTLEVMGARVLPTLHDLRP